MRQLDSEIDRLLTLLRNTIRARGFTQLQVQEVMGWGKSYISQLLTKQKKIRVDQVLQILNVIGADPAEFYAELYQERGPRRQAARTPAPPGPSETEELRLEFLKLKALLDGAVGVLLKKNLITSRDLRAAARAAEREMAAGEG